VVLQRFADSIFEDFIHAPPFEKRVQ